MKNIINLIGCRERPLTSIEDMNGIIGQKDAVMKLKDLIQDHSVEHPFPTVLFTGSHGLGKTFMAEKVARSLGRKLVVTNCGSFKTVSDFIEKVLFSQVFGGEEITLLLDESHVLTENHKVGDYLLSLLNPVSDNFNLVPFDNGLIKYDFTRVNTIFATTDSYAMKKALVNRARPISFVRYSNEELLEMLAMYCKGVEFKCDRDELAFACRGRARDTVFLANDIRRKCSGVLTQAVWDKYCDTWGIYPLGLRTDEARLLGVLYEYGVLSSGNVASKLGVYEDTVRKDLVIRPIELDLVETSSRGLALTGEGRKYIEKVSVSV